MRILSTDEFVQADVANSNRIFQSMTNFEHFPRQRRYISEMRLDHLLAQENATPEDVVQLLVDEYYAAIYHFAMTLLDDADEADDVAQQTIITAARKISAYQPHTNLRAWVYKFAANIARRHLRKRGRWQRLLGRVDRPKSPTLSPEEAVIDKERSYQLGVAVRQLAAKHRIPIVLRYVLDLPTKEIALILDIPDGTVRSRLHYAERELHGLLTAAEVTN